MSGFSIISAFFLSGARCAVCPPGSLIGFALIAQRCGLNRQSQASKSNATLQKTDGKRQAAISSSLFSCIPITSIKVQLKQKEKRRLS